MSLLKLFDTKIVNTGRQHAFDLCKTVSIILMIICHVFYVFPHSSETTVNGFFLAHNLVRLLGAQFFMFCMGMGIEYSKRNSAGSCFKRGLIVLAMGYLLNFLREILPWYLIGTYPLFSNIMSNSKLLIFLSGDILHFAGLAFIFFAIVKKLKFSNLAILVTTLFITVIGAFCTNEIFVKITPDNYYFSFIGLFVPIQNFTVNDYVCFSFCNWIIYPVAGFFWGKVIKHCKYIDVFYFNMFFISLPIFLLAWASFDAIDKNIWLILMNKLVYHQQNPIILAIYLNIIVIAISAFHFIAKYLTKYKVWEIIKHFSRELPTLYIVSWIIIGWIGAWLKYNHMILTKSFDSIFIVFVFVLVLSEIYILIKNRLKKIGNNK